MTTSTTTCVIPGCTRTVPGDGHRCRAHRTGESRPATRPSSRPFASGVDYTEEEVPSSKGERIVRRTHRSGRVEIVYLDKSGVPHREDGPAMITTNNGYRYEEWFVHGDRHREGAPAIIERDENGVVGFSFYEKALLHRTDGPAKVVVIDDGVLETWWIRGEQLRLDGGPIETKKGSDGSVVDRWRRKEKLHRIDGPAVVTAPADGGSCHGSYYYRGVSLGSAEAFRVVLEGLDRATLLEEISRSGSAILLREKYRPQAIIDAIATGVVTSEGVIEVAHGAPVEWVRAFEEAGRK